MWVRVFRCEADIILVFAAWSSWECGRCPDSANWREVSRWPTHIRMFGPRTTLARLALVIPVALSTFGRGLVAPACAAEEVERARIREGHPYIRAEAVLVGRAVRSNWGAVSTRTLPPVVVATDVLGFGARVLCLADKRCLDLRVLDLRVSADKRCIDLRVSAELRLVRRLVVETGATWAVPKAGYRGGFVPRGRSASWPRRRRRAPVDWLVTAQGGRPSRSVALAPPRSVKRVRHDTHAPCLAAVLGEGSGDIGVGGLCDLDESREALPRDAYSLHMSFAWTSRQSILFAHVTVSWIFKSKRHVSSADARTSRNSPSVASAWSSKSLATTSVRGTRGHLVEAGRGDAASDGDIPRSRARSRRGPVSTGRGDKDEARTGFDGRGAKDEARTGFDGALTLIAGASARLGF